MCSEETEEILQHGEMSDRALTKATFVSDAALASATLTLTMLRFYCNDQKEAGGWFRNSPLTQFSLSSHCSLGQSNQRCKEVIDIPDIHRLSQKINRQPRPAASAARCWNDSLFVNHTHLCVHKPLISLNVTVPESYYASHLYHLCFSYYCLSVILMNCQAFDRLITSRFVQIKAN